MYKEHVVLQFLKLLHSRRIDTRLLLLTHLKPILPYIPKKDISKVLLPKLLTGLRDTSDVIVSLTFHCLGDLVPEIKKSEIKVFSYILALRGNFGIICIRVPPYEN